MHEESRSSFPEERRMAILQEVVQRRVVRAGDLARRFGVSAETIRRDLLALEREGLTRRVYGGTAAVRRSPAEASFEQRRVERAEQKQAMAREAAALIEPGDTCIFDVGTSVAQVASQLSPAYHGRVLTNSLLVAIELAGREDVDLLTSGGRVRPGDLACSGPQVVDFYAGFHGGKAFLGSGGVDAATGLTDYYLDEVSVRRVIIERADELYVMADSSKMGQTAPIAVCPLERLTAVITDDGVDPEVHRSLEEAGVRVIVATVQG
jgi:DeoR family fructose operon transcriptional repressor